MSEPITLLKPEESGRNLCWSCKEEIRNDPKVIAAYPPADITVERIGELAGYDFPAPVGRTST